MNNSEIKEPEIAFHHQPDGDQSIGDLIKCHAEKAEKIWIASAFLTKAGLDLLENISEKCKEIRIICGVSGSISELPELRDWVEADKKVREGKVFSESFMFHPKLYIFFKKKDKITLFIGSGNFTKNGTERNEEILMEFENDKTDFIVEKITKYFNELWDKRTIRVDEYLNKHKDYKPIKAKFEELSKKQKEILKNIVTEIDKDVKYVSVFNNKVNKTLKDGGQQTILKGSKNYEAFDRYWGKIGGKLDNKWRVKLFEKDDLFDGRLYKHYPSKRHHNFRIQVLNKGKIELNKHIKMNQKLRYEFDFENEICMITKVK